MPQLTPFTAIRTHLFVRIKVDHYKETEASAPRQEILRFSDTTDTVVINGESYTGLGNLLSISGSASEIRASSGELNISVSGIPNTALSEIIHSRIKGCPVTIYRSFFDPITNEPLDIPNQTVMRYRGFVNNYSLQEDYDTQARQATNTITLVCASAIDVLQNKYAGRKTNPASHYRFYPGDQSMDRVPVLENTTFNFGGTQ